MTTSSPLWSLGAVSLALALAAVSEPLLASPKLMTVRTPTETVRGDWTLFSNTSCVEDITFDPDGKTV
ncbi:MAG: hypothetical protein ACK2UX_00900, partial [Anaerolineae bacterium]